MNEIDKEHESVEATADRFAAVWRELKRDTPATDNRKPQLQQLSLFLEDNFVALGGKDGLITKERLIDAGVHSTDLTYQREVATILENFEIISKLYTFTYMKFDAHFHEVNDLIFNPKTAATDIGKLARQALDQSTPEGLEASTKLLHDELAKYTDKELRQIGDIMQQRYKESQTERTRIFLYWRPALLDVSNPIPPECERELLQSAEALRNHPNATFVESNGCIYTMTFHQNWRTEANDIGVWIRHDGCGQNRWVK